MARLKVSLEIGLKRLEIFTRGLVNTDFLGNYKSVFKGKGLEFLEYRNYSPSSDAKLIDWKAIIRSNQLLVKEFIEERNLDVFFLVDASESMAFASISKLKCEYAAEFASCLTYAILKTGDKVGYALFNDKIIKDAPPKGGVKQFYKFSEILANPRNYGGRKNLRQAINFLSEVVKERSLVFVVSDFIGASDDLKKSLELATAKLDIIGVMVRDPIDKKMPAEKGQIALIDVESDQRLIVEPRKIRQDYARETRREEKEIEAIFIDNKCSFLNLCTNESFVEPLVDLFVMRAKKWR